MGSYGLVVGCGRRVCAVGHGKCSAHSSTATGCQLDERGDLVCFVGQLICVKRVGRTVTGSARKVVVDAFFDLLRVSVHVRVIQIKTHLLDTFIRAGENKDVTSHCFTLQ